VADEAASGPKAPNLIRTGTIGTLILLRHFQTEPPFSPLKIALYGAGVNLDKLTTAVLVELKLNPSSFTVDGCASSHVNVRHNGTTYFSTTPAYLRYLCQCSLIGVACVSERDKQSAEIQGHSAGSAKSHAVKRCLRRSLQTGKIAAVTTAINYCCATAALHKRSAPVRAQLKKEQVGLEERVFCLGVASKTMQPNTAVSRFWKYETALIIFGSTIKYLVLIDRPAVRGRDLNRLKSAALPAL
jgi:hypothetical protein